MNGLQQLQQQIPTAFSYYGFPAPAAHSLINQSTAITTDPNSNHSSFAALSTTTNNFIKLEQNKPRQVIPNFPPSHRQVSNPIPITMSSIMHPSAIKIENQADTQVAHPYVLQPSQLIVAAPQFLVRQPQTPQPQRLVAAAPAVFPGGWQPQAPPVRLPAVSSKPVAVVVAQHMITACTSTAAGVAGIPASAVGPPLTTTMTATTRAGQKTGSGRKRSTRSGGRGNSQNKQRAICNRCGE